MPTDERPDWLESLVLREKPGPRAAGLESLLSVESRELARNIKGRLADELPEDVKPAGAELGVRDLTIVRMTGSSFLRRKPTGIHSMHAGTAENAADLT